MRKRALTMAAVVFMLVGSVAASAPHAAAQANLKYRVTIYNLTNDQVFSPPVIATHKPGVSVFRAGTAAGDALRKLAEDGMTEPLRGELDANPDVLNVVAALAPIPPGGVASFDVAAMGQFDRLSAVGMLVSTNDAFFGLDSLDVDFDGFSNNSEISTLVPAYDAGTENNSESCAFIPGPPCGNGGVRDTNGAEGRVGIHRGIHGVGDLDEARFDWRNPVAKIVVSRQR